MSFSQKDGVGQQRMEFKLAIFLILLLFIAVGLQLGRWASGGSPSPDSHAGESGQGESWPLRAEYQITGRVSPELSADMATTSYVFEGSGWGSWRNYEVGLRGGCSVRSGTSLFLSSDGCRTEAFSDDYDLREGQPYGANAFMRINGGIPESTLGTATAGSDSLDGTFIAERLGVKADNLEVVEYSSSVPCGEVGMSCDFSAVESTTQVLHEPTGLLLSEESTFDGYTLYSFAVTDVQFGITGLPSELQ